MATLVSSTTLSPLTGIDTLEFSLDDLAHFLRVVRRYASREISERRRAFLDGHGERDFAAVGESLGPSKGPEHAVLEHGLERFLHRAIVADFYRRQTRARDASTAKPECRSGKTFSGRSLLTLSRP